MGGNSYQFNLLPTSRDTSLKGKNLLHWWKFIEMCIRLIVCHLWKSLLWLLHPSLSSIHSSPPAIPVLHPSLSSIHPSPYPVHLLPPENNNEKKILDLNSLPPPPPVDLDSLASYQCPQLNCIYNLKKSLYMYSIKVFINKTDKQVRHQCLFM